MGSLSYLCEMRRTLFSSFANGERSVPQTPYCMLYVMSDEIDHYRHVIVGFGSQRSLSTTLVSQKKLRRHYK
eukprot:scaffold145576_cov40-Attheya_sp.AAC.2